MKKKPFIVEVTETYQRRVIVYAEDQYDAYDITANLCNNDEIEVTYEHFISRDLDIEELSDKSELDWYPCFNKTEEDEYDA